MPTGDGQVTAHPFSRAPYRGACRPGHVVDRGRAVPAALCERVEAACPAGLTVLGALAHAATGEFDDLRAAGPGRDRRGVPVRRPDARLRGHRSRGAGRPARPVSRHAARTAPPRPGTRPAGAEHQGGRSRQLRDASASFHVVDGRITAAALAGSGWK